MVTPITMPRSGAHGRRLRPITKVTPKERLGPIAEEMGQETHPENLTSELVRLGGRRLVEKLLEAMQRRTEVLERLVVEMYARGLSTRDIEDPLADLTEGEGSLVGRSSVSRVTEVLWVPLAFSERDLTTLDVSTCSPMPSTSRYASRRAVRRGSWLPGRFGPTGSGCWCTWSWAARGARRTGSSFSGASCGEACALRSRSPPTGHRA